MGAYLDLAIAYLLLCGSTLAFFASKFLSFFGLCLPCPCNGFFGNPNGDNCLQKFLVDYPTERISSVQLCVKSKFPFDSVWANEGSPHPNWKLLKGRNSDDRAVGLEGEASCSSFWDVMRSPDIAGKDSISRNGSCGVMNTPALKEGKSDTKGERVSNQRPKTGVRRRRRSAVDHGKFSSVSSFDPPRLDAPSGLRSPSSVSETGEAFVGKTLVPDASGGEDGFQDELVPILIDLGERALHGIKLNEHIDEDRPSEKDASSAEEVKCNARGKLSFNGNTENTVRVLEQALEEEHAARAALYLELEKERSAAATAADEAMAMILRIQEEKASIEMEARQFQRIIEEKSAYDAEEMNLLKEILLRREREKHFLEKEVEAYRQMMFSENDLLEGNTHDIVDTPEQRPISSLYLSEDPVLMLRRISESIDKEEKVKDADRCSVYESTSIEMKYPTLAFSKELPIPNWEEDADLSKGGEIHVKPNVGKHHSHKSGLNGKCNEEFQEKGMLPVDENQCAQKRGVQKLGACSQLYRSSSSQENSLLEKASATIGEDQKQSDEIKLFQGIISKTTKTHAEAEMHVPHDGEDLDKLGKTADHESKDHCCSAFDIEPRVHDVHVIDHESNLCNEANESKIEQTPDIPAKLDPPVEASLIQRIGVVCDFPMTSTLESETNNDQSFSDITNGLPPLGGSRGKALLSDMRRHSISSVDNERLKIETEVERLRERLRIVQEGREKLNFSVEHKERENIQLQLLEDIASQLREIRQLTEPGKAVRQASLPPPSSKVMSKKRRWRSASLGVHQST